MLKIKFPTQSVNCDGTSRRDFLQIGSLAGLGALSLPNLLATKAHAGSREFIRDKSVVLLYLSGGASHIETFDPKMDAPDGVRSVTGELQTTLPGVTFGGTYPQLSQHARNMAIVRSFAHSVGSHDGAHVHVLSGGTDPAGRQAEGFSMGSAFAQLRGANHPDTGLPTYVLMTEEEIDGQYRKELGRVIKGSWPGSLGPSVGPMQHEIGWRAEKSGRKKSKNNPLAANMELTIEQHKLEDRLGLLKQIDGLNRRMDTNGTMGAVDKFSQQALSLILGGAADAFDLEKESPQMLERYDTSSMRIGHKTFRPSTLGKQMLVARRLCEAGCGFVTVHSAGWDMHADGNNPGMVTGMEMLGRTMDRAVSAFLTDVHERGLSKKILLVITGDFGRTPKVNKKGGRDHWARLGTLAFAGGGLKMGQVIGKSARDAGTPASNPIGPQNLMATILNTLFDAGELRLETGIPRPLIELVDNNHKIGELF